MGKKVEIALILKDKFSKELKEANTGFQKLTQTFKKLGLAIGAGVGLYGLGRFFKSSVEEALRYQDALQQVKQGLETTGGAAGLTLQELQEFADVMEELAGVEDEVVLQGESLLLTFTKVRGEVFKKGIELALDLSKRFNQDLKSSIIQVGFALNDPIQGVTRLRRVGVSFTEAQREMIEKFVELGEIEKAQAVIIDELTTEVGGSARAFRETFAGSVTAVGHAVGDFKKELGLAITNSKAWREAFEVLAQSLNTITEQVKNNTGSWSELMTVAGNFVKTMAEGMPTVAQYVGKFGEIVWTVLKGVGETIGAIGAALVELVHGHFKNAWQIVEDWSKSTGWEEIEQHTQQIAQDFKKVKENTEQAKETFDGFVATIKAKIPEADSLLKRHKITWSFFGDWSKDMQNALGDTEGAIQNMADTVDWRFSEILNLQRQIAQGFSDTLVDALFTADKNFTAILKHWIAQLGMMIVKETIAAALIKAIQGPGAVAGTVGGSILDLLGFKEGGIVQGFKPLTGAFQEGGVVTRPTLALVGEGGEKEYIIPESKFPKPEVYVTIHNANPDTYAEVLVKMSPEKMDKLVREGIKPALEREAIL